MGPWLVAVQAFWLLLPAYVANSAAVIFGGGIPMDFGRRLSDGRRLLGDGKTWSGTFGGIMIGFVLGLTQLGLGFLVDPQGLLGFGSIWPGLLVILLMPAGALMGDMMGAFIKRRLGKERGEKAPGLDQYDFVIGTFVLLLVFFPGWTMERYFIGWGIVGFATILTVTPALHRGVNIIGYMMGKKKEPW